MLTQLDNDNAEFILKQGDKAVVATLNLRGLKELPVLSGGGKTDEIMTKLKSEMGNRPEDWLQAFYLRATYTKVFSTFSL